MRCFFTSSKFSSWWGYKLFHSVLGYGDNSQRDRIHIGICSQMRKFVSMQTFDTKASRHQENTMTTKLEQTKKKNRAQESISHCIPSPSYLGYISFVKHSLIQFLRKINIDVFGLINFGVCYIQII